MKLTKKIAIATVAGIIFLVPALLAAQQSAAFYVNGMDSKQNFPSMTATGKIIIKDQFGQKTITFKTYNKNRETYLINFTSKAEKGQRMLRQNSVIYLYYPYSETNIKLQGAALRQPMLGSDASYDDVSQEGNTLDRYNAKLMGSAAMRGHSTQIVYLTAKVKNVAYYGEKIWIDKKTFVPWKTEYYTKQGKLLKEIEIYSVSYSAALGRFIPTHLTVDNKLDKHSITEVFYGSIDTTTKLSDDLFKLGNLSY